MRVLIAVVLLMVSAATLSGCSRLKALLDPEPPWKPVAEELAPVIEPKPDLDVLTYYDFLGELTEVELGREYRAIKQRFAATAAEEDRWRLILLAILPNQPFSDRDYALELLRERQETAEVDAGPRAALGRLLALLLADQRELNRKLGEEKETSEKLAQQLQELKEIEEILSEREKKRPATK